MLVHGERRRDRFAAVAARLSAGLRANAEAQSVRVARGRERIETLGARAARAALTLIDRRQARLERAGQLLAALSYHGVLARGFALVRAEDGRPLRAAAAVGQQCGSTSIRRQPCPGNVRRCDRRRQDRRYDGRRRRRPTGRAGPFWRDGRRSGQAGNPGAAVIPARARCSDAPIRSGVFPRFSALIRWRSSPRTRESFAHIAAIE
jgi:hypothetical protein